MTCLMPLAKLHDPAGALDFPCAPGVAAATVAPIAASVIAAAARAITSPFFPISIPPLKLTGGNLRQSARCRRVQRISIWLHGGDDSGPGETHALVHLLERWFGLGVRLLGARCEHAAQLALVGPQLFVAALDRDEQLDDSLADVLLEPAVAAAVVAGLEVGNRVACRDRHDLEQVRDPGLLLAVVPDFGAGVR